MGPLQLDCRRRSGVADVVMLVCVIGLALATWIALSQVDGAAARKLCVGIFITVFLALAAITPRESCAIAVRLAMSGWLIIAPWLLSFADSSLARWSHVLTGSLIALLSIGSLVTGLAEKHATEAPWGVSGDALHIALRRMWS
jgi:hypothetical protein